MFSDHKTFFMKPFIILSTFIMLCLVTAGCINEDDGVPGLLQLPVISVSDQTIQEGDADNTIEVTVNLTGENTTNAIIQVAAVGGTAISGSDYTLLTTDRLIFKPGEVSKTIFIKIVGDEVKEPRETFEVKLYNPQNVEVGKDVAYIIIEDDDDNTAGLVIPTGGTSSPESYEGYTLVWADEFEGTSLNTNDWTFEIGDGCPGNCGWGNNELEYYREDNTTLVDGHLVITAKKQQFGDHEYTSSRIITKGKKVFKFGRIDIRAALPEGKGIWPALWMLGANIDAVGWPASGEIDIMELTGDVPDRVVSTVHYGSNFGEHQFNSVSTFADDGESFQDEFHVYSLNWEDDLLEFMVDGEIVHTITPASMKAGQPYPFNKNFFFIFNVAVGGNWPGSPDGTTAFPQHLIVDYIRVFQK